MELTEIVSIHVALPVIGVLICAALVFALGFRSPVQPPSFHFSDDKKNQKKTKKTKGKGQTNGHVVPVKDETPTVKTLTPKSARQNNSTTKPKSPANEKKKKVEKSPRVVNEKPKPKPEEEIEQDDEGWSVAVSKKKDKIRSKREEKGGDNAETKLTLEDIGFETKTEDGPTEIPTPEEPPQEQRTSKKKRQPKKTEEETTPEVEVTPEPLEEVKAPSPPEPIPDTKAEEKPSSTNKKGKNKPENKVAEEKTENKPTPEAAPANNKNTKKSKSKKLSADAEEFQPMMYDTKPKAQTSPKKQKAKNNSQTSESAAEEVINSPAEEIREVLKPVEEKKDKPVSEPVKNKVKDEKINIEDKKETVVSESKTDQPVVFDELAATTPTWQDAPKTKKKKARREN